MGPTSRIPPLPLPHGAASRNTDVYVGFCCRRPSSTRFLNWVRAELESSGVSCFAYDRSSCPDASSHRAARAAMDAATVGVVLVTPGSFANPYSMEEIDVFLERKNLLPIFLGLRVEECSVGAAVTWRGEAWKEYGGLEEEWRRAVAGLCCVECKLEVDAWNWRDCVAEAVAFVGMRLGRRGVVERQEKWKEMEGREFPLVPCGRFVGREEELVELEMMLFGCVEGYDESQRLKHEGCCATLGDSSREGVGDGTQKGKDLVVAREGEMEQQPVGGAVNAGMAFPLRHVGRCRRGIACVSGGSGVGKTELVLEFVRRFAKRYRMVLWVCGGARYLRQNFARLLPLLGMDGNLEDGSGGMGRRRSEPVNFKDLEEEIVERLREELSKGIPFLIVVDDLESENDWWEGRSIVEFLPESSSAATHAIVSTKLPRVANVEPLILLPLPAPEAMQLMSWGVSGDLPVEEVDALESIMERLGGITLGISIVGAILREIPIRPTRLLDVVRRVPQRNIEWSHKDDPVLKNNPFLLQLLDVCLLIFNIADGHEGLASRMVLASCWFAPSSISVPLLSLAAYWAPRSRRREARFWSWSRNTAPARVWERLRAARLKPEASSILVAFRMARRCTNEGHVQFHDVVRLYARKTGDLRAAISAVRAINAKGSLPQHSEHLWAACFLLFKFGTEPPTVDLKVPELLCFIRRVVIPLASEASRVFCHYKAAIALLGQATEALEDLEEAYVSEAQKELERISCCGAPPAGRSYVGLDPFTYQDLALLRATLLEMRAMVMLKGGCYDIAKQLCRSTISIREVFYGQEHPEVVSIRETMEKSLDPSRGEKTAFFPCEDVVGKEIFSRITY